MSTPDYSLVVQGSEMWAQLRCGLVTASRASDVIATLKNGKGEKAERANYRTEIICERLTGVPYPQFVTKEMQWGLDHEDEAVAAYELQEGILADRCGFVIHPTVDRFGASPDRLIGDKGILQVKCPTTRTHLDWMLGGVIPIEHIPQLLAELSCNPEREWCDFMSYDPRLPEHLQKFIRRYPRDDQARKLIAALEGEVQHFNREIDQVLGLLPQGPQPAAKLLEMPMPDEAEF